MSFNQVYFFSNFLHEIFDGTYGAFETSFSRSLSGEVVFSPLPLFFALKLCSIVFVASNHELVAFALE